MSEANHKAQPVVTDLVVDGEWVRRTVFHCRFCARPVQRRWLRWRHVR